MTERYSITSEMRGEVEIYILRDADQAYAEVAPQFGNNCFVFRGREPILEPIPFEQFCQKPTSYGIPILFPYPNRIRDGEFDFRGEHFKVDQKQHGFVRHRPWRVEGSGASIEEGAWITSSLDATDYREEILKQYPFPFRIEVTWRLIDGRLAMETEIRNTGEREMPTGFGIHPYFRRPATGTVQVPARKRWELADSLPTGKKLELDEYHDLRRPRSLSDLKLDDIYVDLIPDEGTIVRCAIGDEGAKTQTIVEFDARQFPHVVVFTAPAPRQAICVEPNTCPTDAFNLLQRGIENDVVVLRPGETKNYRILIYERASEK
jgi:aldose 1-epimerase